MPDDPTQNPLLDSSFSGAPWSAVSPIIEHFESGSRNILQQVVGPTESTAGGYWQINDPTWHDMAPKAGVDLEKYPNWESAPREVQNRVGQQLYAERGIGPWSNYNARLANALGLPAHVPLGTYPATGQLNMLAGGAASPSAPAVTPNMDLVRANALAATQAAPAGSPTINLGRGGEAGPGDLSPWQRLTMLGMIQRLTQAGTHRFTRVDYDPWRYTTRVGMRDQYQNGAGSNAG